MAKGMRAAVAVCASIASLDGLVPRKHGFSGPTFFHKNNGLAPEWLFLQPRKINRLNRFFPNKSERDLRLFHDFREQREARKQADL
jgi:hypothetical protein